MAMRGDGVGRQHPFLDGRLKRVLVGGKWVEAASGKTFDSLNPATGEMRASVAESNAEGIKRAVASARRAFEGRGVSGSRSSDSSCCSSWRIWSSSTSTS
jgi:hypothetical protein